MPYLQHRCLDILQPDCCHSGGISQMKKIAALAETFQVPLAPHCTASNLGIAASLHVVASIPLFLIHEYYPDNQGFNPAGIGRMPCTIDKDGYISLPPGPGLGVEMDEKELEKRARKPQTYRWPGRGCAMGRCRIIDRPALRKPQLRPLAGLQAEACSCEPLPFPHNMAALDTASNVLNIRRLPV